MKKFIFVLLIFPLFLSAQNINNANDNAPSRDVSIAKNGDVTIRWEFPEYIPNTISENNTDFQKLMIPGFGFMHDIGKPDLPAYIDHIGIPETSEANISINEIKYHPVKKDFLLFPSQPPRQDNYKVEDPPFTMDTTFYNSNTSFPASHISVDETQNLRDIKVAAIQIIPFQYNAVQKELKSVKEISITIQYNGNPNSITDGSQHSNQFAKIAGNYFLNGSQIANQISTTNTQTSKDPDYLIVTTQQYLPAAEKLSQWKSQLGFIPEIIVQNNWNSGQVKNAIHNKYNDYSPKPDYFVILGDHEDVPGEILTGNNNDMFASDHYYSCMDGSGDYTSDMARGRISVASLSEANTIVDKIINYEKYPVTDSSFYETGTNCAYFQHAGGGYAERRFAQTSEELRDYAIAQGKTVNRVYHASSNVTPTYWNNTYYSNGEPLPSYLTKPNFAWDGDKNDIINYVNNGTFYVFHRDHGYEDGWGDPSFHKSDINSFTNGDKQPLFFSINCLTGKFLESECFSEKLLRKPNGGAIGVFGHAEVSYSGYNDALSLGLFDGIWSNPGLTPDFTGSGGTSNPVIPAHGNIRRGGDLINFGLQYMTASWGNSQYTHELLHYFGDPAMEIRVDSPSPILANNTDSISCSSDSIVVINNINTDSVTATFVVDGQLVAKDIINSSADSLIFDNQTGAIAGNMAILTLSKPGHQPYIDTIDITGGCPKAKIDIGTSLFCLSDSITFSENSLGNINSYSWDFGNGASQSTASSSGPHTINYASSSSKTVYLTVTTPSGLSHTDSVSFSIDSICRYKVPTSGNTTITRCEGKLFDDGGQSAPYSNNSDGSVTISEPNASSISLIFSSFHFEDGYDYLKIYDGASTNAPLIDSYDGNTLPGSGVINSSTNAITIQQMTDEMQTESGFELLWKCAYPNTLPTAEFKVNDSSTCTGLVTFQDQSIAGPTSWFWDFGDGTTSTQRNPSHQYTSNGNYDVKLIASNMHGPDSVLKTNLVTVDMPDNPTASSGIRCQTGSVELTATEPSSGNGYIRWFNSATSPNVLDTGTTYTTPILGNSKTFYVDYANDKPALYGAKTDNNGGGSYFDQPYKHHLVFDVHKQITLVSVKVYANSAGNRNIELIDRNGNPIESQMVNLQQGEQRVNLNFSISPGTDYKLRGPEDPDLFRNNNGTNYPYYVNDLVTIKESSAGSDPTGYYYYFYDWEVKGPPCRSNRVPVQAIISDTLKPNASFNYDLSNEPEIQFKDKSEYVSSYLWAFGDGNTSALPNPTHTFQDNGTYDVKLKAINNCGEDSVIQQIQINSVSVEEHSKNTLNVYPNPTDDLITIIIPDNIKGSKVLEVFDSKGKQISSDIIMQQHTQINKDLSNLASGTYLILLHTDNDTKQAKVIVQ
ncbi:MAG: C25 family cysteine peptidase [Bacteroidota bacterium]